LRVYVKTLGCRLNQYESDLIAAFYKKRGHEVVSSPVEADLVVVNSCTVTSGADSDTRKFIRKLKNIRPDVKIVVTGCYASVPHGFASLSEMKETDVILPNFRKYRILKDFLLLELPLVRAKAFVAIQRGCSWNCSYCLIKPARGLPISRSPDDISREVSSLFETSVGEVVLTGTDLGLWKWNEKDLAFLLFRLAELVPKNKRLSVSSLGPHDFTDSLLEVLGHPSIAKHLHLSIQSFSDSVLRRMRRPYSASRAFEVVEKVFKRLPGWGVGADIMVGFPGESEKDFKQTYSVLRDMPFAYFHVFPFSPRPGTDAWSWRKEVPSKKIVAERVRKLLELSLEKRFSFVKTFIKTSSYLDVLVEKLKVRGDGVVEIHGTSSEYIKVFSEIVENDSDEVLEAGSIVKVKPASLFRRGFGVVVKGILDWERAF